MNILNTAEFGLAPSPRTQVEAFSRDLLQLVRGVRTYPAAHPALQGAARRIVSALSDGIEGQWILGISASELSVDRDFYGGDGTHSAALARLLHSRKILKLNWTPQVSAGDILNLATRLSEPSLVGEDFRTSLLVSGVLNLDVVPLDFDLIHGEICATALEGETGDDAERGRQLWLRLQDGVNLSAGELASILASSEVGARIAISGLEPDLCEAVVRNLVQVGERLDDCLPRLPEAERTLVLERLSMVGRQLPPAELIRVVSQGFPGWDLQSPALAALLAQSDADRFVDLIAAIMAEGGKGTRRLAAIYRKFAPEGARQGVVNEVKTRLALSDHRGFAGDVWKAVEEFVLKLEEDPFMGEDYFESLEELSGPESDQVRGDGTIRGDLEAAADAHLDALYVDLAAAGGPDWEMRLLRRIEARAAVTGARGAVVFLRQVDEALPEFLAARPETLKRYFCQALAGVREASSRERRALVELGVRHERLVLDLCLRALEQESRLAVRRFLVDLLSQFSDEVIPILVATARAGPWYVARNLVIALGAQKDRYAIPVLEDFLRHPHPKVRREASVGLARIRSGRAVRPGVPCTASAREGGR